MNGKRSVLFASIFFLFLAGSCGSGESTNNTTVSSPDSTSAMIESLENGTRAYPDSGELKLLLAEAYERNGDAGKAINLYDELLVFDSSNTLWYNRKAGLLLSKGDTASTISTLVESLAVNPQQEEIFLELGFLYADQKDKKALKVAEHLINTSGDVRMRTRARYLKGIYFSNTGDKVKALEAYNECILNDYTFIDAHLEKGILLFDQQNYKEALAVFEKARAISNTNADAYFWTGKTYEALKQNKEAIEFYKKAIGLDGSLVEAEERLKKLE